MRKGIVAAVLLAAVLAAASAHAQSSFGLHPPDGWIDLRDPSASVDKIPPGVVREARSGKYLVYAVDPSAVDSIGAKVSFNAIEDPKTGVITDATLHQTAALMTRSMEGTQFSITVTQMRLEKLGGVTVGVLESMMETPRGPMRLLQYLIPGKTHASVLTYGCPPEEYDRYLPIFRASANATTGAYDHSGIKWSSVIYSGALGGAIAGVLALITSLQRKKQAPAAAVVTTTAPTGSALTWECPSCKRRVPARIAECRCGTPRPETA